MDTKHAEEFFIHHGIEVLGSAALRLAFRGPITLVAIFAVVLTTRTLSGSRSRPLDRGVRRVTSGAPRG